MSTVLITTFKDVSLREIEVALGAMVERANDPFFQDCGRPSTWANFTNGTVRWADLTFGSEATARAYLDERTATDGPAIAVRVEKVTEIAVDANALRDAAWKETVKINDIRNAQHVNLDTATGMRTCPECGSVINLARGWHRKDEGTCPVCQCEEFDLDLTDEDRAAIAAAEARKKELLQRRADLRAGRLAPETRTETLILVGACVRD